MYSFVGLLVAFLATATSAQHFRPLLLPPPPAPRIGETYFAYQLKSFRQALDECAEYLAVHPEAIERLISFNYITNEPELRCLIRCTGINLGWWNDTTGVQIPIMESYFLPAPGDTCFVRRTRECFDAKIALCHDDCSKAYESFLCYFHHYGNLKFTNEYVPLTPLDAIQAAVDCINVLQIPGELLEQYSRGVFPDCQETKCLYRCQYIAEGLYDSRLGFNLPRIYAREHEIPDLELLSENTKACTELALRDSCDECTRFFRAHKCFSRCGVIDHTTSVLVQASWIVLGQHTCRRQNPFYLFPPYTPLQSYAPLQSFAPRYILPPTRGCKFANN
ncbi:uncharacterized protein LOC131433807 [Malaya genurostris]|uniref:uncharacterized protein LOC131433807 n=1 Tax=Malaya genurostris TaxID=325434 RepID=UPI0026F3E093|nr:uncharacterized protein LOC131433807 [Malaya genurostris]